MHFSFALLYPDFPATMIMATCKTPPWAGECRLWFWRSGTSSSGSRLGVSTSCPSVLALHVRERIYALEITQVS